MIEQSTVSPELEQKVEDILKADKSAVVTLRGLYRLYFDSKLSVPVHDKAFLLGKGFEYSAGHLPYAKDKPIFDAESKRFYDRQRKQSQTKKKPN